MHQPVAQLSHWRGILLSVVFNVVEGSVAAGSAAGVEVSHSQVAVWSYGVVVRILLRLRLVTLAPQSSLISAANAVTRWPVFLDALVQSLWTEVCLA